MIARSKRHAEIMDHVEIQFRPQQQALLEKHNQELREAQYRARQTHNAAAILPAEADCAIAHAVSVVKARAEHVANAFTTFNESVDRDADVELVHFYMQVVGGAKAGFEGSARLLHTRTGHSLSQLPPILTGFETKTHDALAIGRAIFDRQRVEFKNRPTQPIGTKYVIDTCVFNWLADGRIGRHELPTDGGFAITHVQMDEINATVDKDRRAMLLLGMLDLHCELISTRTFVADISRPDHARAGDGQLCSAIRATLDALRKKNNNMHDALIADAAIGNNFTLITADADLKSATETNGGKVLHFSK